MLAFRIIIAIVLLLAPSGRAAAQSGSTAQPVIPGYNYVGGTCPTNMVCFQPFGPSGTPSKPASLTILPLDISSVTTGGTAVNALAAGHASAGGFVVTSNAAGICINERGAAGTASSGDTACVAQNQPYYLAPTSNAISVNSSSSSVTLAGYGYQ